VGQIGIALLIGLFAVGREDIGSSLMVPFSHAVLELPPLVFVLLNVFVMVATSNAVNITDGLDGLAAGTTATAALAFAILAWLGGSADMAIFFAAVTGACLGFAWFNAHPAQVFMG